MEVAFANSEGLFPVAIRDTCTWEDFWPTWLCRFDLYLISIRIKGYIRGLYRYCSNSMVFFLFPTPREVACGMWHLFERQHQCSRTCTYYPLVTLEHRIPTVLIQVSVMDISYTGTYSLRTFYQPNSMVLIIDNRTHWMDCMGFSLFEKKYFNMLPQYIHKLFKYTGL